MKSSPQQYNGWLVDLWIVNDGCDDKVDADDQHNDRDDDRALERYFMMTMDLVMTPHQCLQSPGDHPSYSVLTLGSVCSVYTNITNKNVIIITIITYCHRPRPRHAHITGGI